MGRHVQRWQCALKSACYRVIALVGFVAAGQGPFTDGVADTRKWDRPVRVVHRRVNALAFGDRGTGLAVGWPGVMFVTTDGGESWARVCAPTTEAFCAIAFVGPSRALVFTRKGTVFVWRAGADGVDAVASPVHDSLVLRAATFSGASRGWVVGDEGKVLRTEDGGHTWALCRSGGADLHDVFFLDSLQGWIVGTGGEASVTSDGGLTWTKARTGTREPLNAVWFVDSLHGWIVGKGRRMLRTRTGGRRWRCINVPRYELHDVYFTDRNHGCAVGPVAGIIVSGDGGETWQEPGALKPGSLISAEGRVAELRAVILTDTGTGWAAGESGIYVTKDGCQTWGDANVDDEPCPRGRGAR